MPCTKSSCSPRAARCRIARRAWSGFGPSAPGRGCATWPRPCSPSGRAPRTGCKRGWSAGSARNRDRLEALELEEGAALERDGISGDVDADRRRVTLGAYVRLFAEGVGEIAAPDGRLGPEFGREITAIMRREAPHRRAVERATFEAWSGSPLEGVLEQARLTAAPPEPEVVRMLEAAGVWSYIRTLCIALGEALEPAPAVTGDG